MEIIISYFNSENFIHGLPTPQDEVLDIIKSDRYKHETDILRNKLAGDEKKDERRNYKTSKLPLVTFGGIFNKPRSKANLKQHSGQASIDFDEYDKTKSDNLFEQLKNDKYVHIMFRSPSYGIKVIVKIPIVKSDEEYKQYFYAIFEHFSKYSPSQDTGCADVSRLCFLSHDPYLYKNDNSETFTNKSEKKTELKIKKVEECIPENCPFIEKIASVHNLPSGEKTRHAYLDGNVWKYCAKNNRTDILNKYMKAQGRTLSAFKDSDKFEFSCGTIRNYLHGNKKENGYVLEGLKICDECTEYKKYKKADKQLILPGNGKLISEVAEELVSILKDKMTIFYKPQENSVVEIRKIKHEENITEEFLGFSEMNSNRFISCIEKYIIPGVEVYNEEEDRYIFKPKSMPKNNADVILESEKFQYSLPIIKRLFTVPIPIIYDGNITFPKKGYDPRFLSWLPHNAPEIDEPDMPIEKAKEIITLILREFPFQDNNDFVNAIGGLLTPFLRGLYTSFNVRTPVFFYIANRERAGKDYLAGITGIVYEGIALEEPPISNDNNNKSSHEEELRKKLLSAFINGRKRLHFANNKGLINNSVFEQVTTSTKYSDRILGKTNIVTVDNEIEFSLSGNIGVSYTPDFYNRCRFVRLMLDIEDANQRKFKNPNLHYWIFNNRNKILSALYSIVKNWYDNGMKKGTYPFTSFPEWASICGGIMENAKFGNPCKQNDDSFNIKGDVETENMKLLFEYVYELRPEEEITKSEIRTIVELEEEGNIFPNYDFSKKADQTKFGIIIDKFVNRLFSDIKLISDNNKRSSRRKYKFTKELKEKDETKIFGTDIEVVDIESAFVKSGNLATFGNLFPRVLTKIGKVKIHQGIGETLPLVARLPPDDIFDITYTKLVEKIGIPIIPQEKMQENMPEGIFDVMLAHKLEKGDYFVPKTGYLSRT